MSIAVPPLGVRRRYHTSPSSSSYYNPQLWTSFNGSSSAETTPDSSLISSSSSSSSSGSIVEKLKNAMTSTNIAQKQRILTTTVTDEDPRTMDEQEQDEVIDALTANMEHNALKWRITIALMNFCALVVYAFLPLPRVQDFARLPIPRWLCSRTMIITELLLSLLAAYSEILVSLPDTSHTDIPPDDLTPAMIETARRTAYHTATLERVRSRTPSPPPVKPTKPFTPSPELTATLRASKQHKLETNAAHFKWYARMPRIYKDAAKNAPTINLRQLLRMRWPLNIARVPAFTRAAVLIFAVLLPMQTHLLVAPFVAAIEHEVHWTTIPALSLALPAFILGIASAGRSYIDEMDADMEKLKKLKYENKGA